MTICPIAVVAGCRKCPVHAVCPLKTVLGDAGKQPPSASTKPQPEAARKKPRK